MMKVEEALVLIKEKIREMRFPKHPARLYEPITYLLGLKGKKIRPAFTLLACNLFKEDVTGAVNMAVAWEIFHNFTLMHDDVMDQAEMRRGELSVHKKWNENTAILSGDTMLILAYKYVAKFSGKQLKALLELFSTTAIEICEGQQYDTLFERRLNVKDAEYVNMIRLKTAVLLGACLKSGAILGGASARDQNLLYDCGVNLGIAFQIQDDLLDVYGDPAVFGKKIGGDILCNKKTYLLVSALNSANEAAKKELFRWLKTENQPEKKIRAITSLYDRLLLKEKARIQIEEYYQKAIRAFNEVNVPESEKTTLMNLFQKLLNRQS
jgi:geranylgeranyl diphosphate synthase type II